MSLNKYMSLWWLGWAGVTLYVGGSVITLILCAGSLFYCFRSDERDS